MSLADTEKRTDAISRRGFTKAGLTAGLVAAAASFEVLKIVFAGGDQRGGFFPDGVNGSGPLNRA